MVVEVSKNGVYEQVINALEGYTYFEFGGVEPNPSVGNIKQSSYFNQRKNIDFILAVGGGSVIDGSKYLAIASLYDGDGWDFWKEKLQQKQFLLVLF